MKLLRGFKPKTYRVIFYGPADKDLSLVTLYTDQDQALDEGIQMLWKLAPRWNYFRIYQINNLHMLGGMVHEYRLSDEPK